MLACKQGALTTMTKKQLPADLQVDHITRAITVVRGHKVLLDTQLAALYGVETRVLTQAVKRNKERFPGRFHAAAHTRRVGQLEITACDLKSAARRPAIPPLCLY